MHTFQKIHILDWPKEERSRNVTQLIREKLPEENYELFKYLIEFLVKVSARVKSLNHTLNLFY